LSRYNPHHPNAEAVFRSARRWLNRCLIDDGSVFTDDETWTTERVQEVVDYFVRRPDEGEGVFLEKLQTQMQPGSAGAKRLMAELLWVLSLFPSNVKPRSKRSLIRSAWSWSGGELSEDADALSDEVLSGLGSGGPGYNNHRWRELRFLINVTEAAKATPRKTSGAYRSRSSTVCGFNPPRNRAGTANPARIFGAPPLGCLVVANVGQS